MTMKAYFSVLLVLGAVVVTCSQQTASASVVQQGDWVVLSLGDGAVQYGDGGEFRVDVYGPGAFDSNNGPWNSTQSPVQGTFYTFCAAVANVFVPGNAYRVDKVGPVSTVSTSPNVSMKPAGTWLYKSYWDDKPVPTGSLEGYVPGHTALLNALNNNQEFGTGTAAMTSKEVAGALQAEIWNSLGETPPLNYGYEDLVTKANLLFGWDKYTSTDVVVDELSLWGPNNNYGYNNPAQQQLDAYVPVEFIPTSTATPEPASLAIWGLGSVLAVGVVCVRRRKANRT
jgi:hypothetical protein